VIDEPGRDTSAHYGPLLPMGWIGRQPTKPEAVFDVGAPIPDDWMDVLVNRTLAFGVIVSTERRGLSMFDFGDWAPGVSRPVRAGGSSRRLATMAETSEGAKRAVVHRLRLMNAHLCLVYAALMHLENESPRVERIHDSNLYRFDYPDDPSLGGFWYHSTGQRLPDHITASDTRRIGTCPLPAFELSLSWLEDVVKADTLVEFDLLNQTHAAVLTHDYGLAVTAGWTVCELRIRALARQDPMLMTKVGDPANKLVAALEQSGAISGSTAGRLTALRRRRNGWLHSGVEPDEQGALDALEAANVMLRAVVPDLTVRTTRGLLIL